MPDDVVDAGRCSEAFAPGEPAGRPCPSTPRLVIAQAPRADQPLAKVHCAGMAAVERGPGRADVTGQFHPQLPPPTIGREPTATRWRQSAPPCHTRVDAAFAARCAWSCATAATTATSSTSCRAGAGPAAVRCGERRTWSTPRQGRGCARTATRPRSTRRRARGAARPTRRFITVRPGANQSVPSTTTCISSDRAVPAAKGPLTTSSPR